MSLMIAFIILIASFPIGYIVKSLTKEELKSGKKYFQVVWIICLVLSVGMVFYSMSDDYYRQAVIFTLLFIANVAYISWK